VKPGLVCGLEAPRKLVYTLIRKREGRGRSEKKVWPSCAGDVAVLEEDVTADSTSEDGGLPVRRCWPHERTDEVQKTHWGLVRGEGFCTEVGMDIAG
jgi:hypothetical protein